VPGSKRSESHGAVSRRPLVVAVDGPSGSGKSTVSRLVASRLHLEYLDTGAMYRAVCWACLQRGIDIADEAKVADVAHGLDLVMGTDPDAVSVLVDGRDVAAEIRTTQVSAAVSAVAGNQAVRAELRRRQREVIAASGAGERHGVVAEGRDITTVVAPDADVRILLTASEKTRLARRAREVHGSDDASALAATHDQVVRRDADDSRVAQFLEAADGVLQLDSSGLTLEETVDTVIAVIAEHAQIDGVELMGKDLLVELARALRAESVGAGQGA
jgi:CMP/dCMP kinase